jgi:hypothetical protein
LEKLKNQENSAPSDKEDKVQELIDLINVHMAAY